MYELTKELSIPIKIIRKVKMTMKKKTVQPGQSIKHKFETQEGLRQGLLTAFFNLLLDGIIGKSSINLQYLATVIDTNNKKYERTKKSWEKDNKRGKKLSILINHVRMGETEKAKITHFKLTMKTHSKESNNFRTQM